MKLRVKQLSYLLLFVLAFLSQFNDVLIAKQKAVLAKTQQVESEEEGGESSSELFLLSKVPNPTKNDLQKFINTAGTDARFEDLETALPAVIEIIKCIKAGKGIFKRQTGYGAYEYMWPVPKKVEVYYNSFTASDDNVAELLTDFCKKAAALGMTIEKEWAELIKLGDSDIEKKYAYAVDELLDEVRGRIMPRYKLEKALSETDDKEEAWNSVDADRAYGMEVDRLYAEFTTGRPGIKFQIDPDGRKMYSSLSQKDRDWVAKYLLK